MLYVILFLLISIPLFAQQIEKPFVKEHLFHEHTFDFINTSVYQEFKGFGKLYNTSHLFFYLDLNGEDKFFLNSSITFGNGIRKRVEKEGFSLLPTGDDLEGDLRDINGAGRKYILELAYEKSIKNFSISIGLLDSTSYVDTNEYANDEHTQFLNAALINNPVVPLPSYNVGIYFHYELRQDLIFSLLYMDAEPESGNVGIIQFEFSGNGLNIKPYYSYVFGGKGKGFGVSGDATLSENLGIFFRFGAGNSQTFLSGGFELRNLIFKDKIGFGYAYLNEGKKGEVLELYYSIKLSQYLSVSFDVQYLRESKEAFIYGLRLFFER